MTDAEKDKLLEETEEKIREILINLEQKIGKIEEVNIVVEDDMMVLIYLIDDPLKQK